MWFSARTSGFLISWPAQQTNTYLYYNIIQRYIDSIIHLFGISIILFNMYFLQSLVFSIVNFLKKQQEYAVNKNKINIQQIMFCVFSLFFFLEKKKNWARFFLDPLTFWANLKMLWTSWGLQFAKVRFVNKVVFLGNKGLQFGKTRFPNCVHGKVEKFSVFDSCSYGSSLRVSCIKNAFNRVIVHFDSWILWPWE